MLLTQCFLEAFDTASATTEKILVALMKMPEAMRLYNEPNRTRFNVFDQFVHMTQSERFALDFLLPIVQDRQPPFVLREPFASIVAIPDPQARRQSLSNLNLKGAKRQSERLENFENLFEYWKDHRDRAREALSGVPDDLWCRIVRHPLVDLERTFFGMCMLLFCLHATYHDGQATADMKNLCRGSFVPFPFGEFKEFEEPV